MQAKLGEQGNELGQEVRRLRDELDQFRQQAAPQAPQTPFDEDTYDDLLEENPQQALAYALQAGDGYRMSLALKSWYEVDPYSATEWRLDQERRTQAEQFQKQLSGYETHVQNQQLQQAFQNVRARYPDIVGLESEMAQAASENLELLAPLQTGTLESKERAIEGLYALSLLKRGGTPPATGAEPQQAPHVATATQVPDGTVRRRSSVAEGLARAVEADSPSILENWGQITGR